MASEKWSNGHEIASEVIERSDKAISDSLALADRDADAFDSVMTAYRRPRTRVSGNPGDKQSGRLPSELPLFP